MLTRASASHAAQAAQLASLPPLPPALLLQVCASGLLVPSGAHGCAASCIASQGGSLSRTVRGAAKPLPRRCCSPTRQVLEHAIVACSEPDAGEYPQDLYPYKTSLCWLLSLRRVCKEWDAAVRKSSTVMRRCRCVAAEPLLTAPCCPCKRATCCC